MRVADDEGIMGYMGEVERRREVVVVYFGGILTFWPSHACTHQSVFSWEIRGGETLTKPSKIPSPVVAQLGSTFQV